MTLGGPGEVNVFGWPQRDSVLLKFEEVNHPQNFAIPLSGTFIPRGA